MSNELLLFQDIRFAFIHSLPVLIIHLPLFRDVIEKDISEETFERLYRGQMHL